MARHRVWTEYHDRKREQDEARARIPELRLAAGVALKACLRAESELAELESTAEAARADALESRRRLESAEREHAEATRNLTERRAELESHAARRLERFLAHISKLSIDPNWSKKVVELEIEYPARRLPDDVVLIDAPAIFSQVDDERNRAWELIRGRADGCILIAELDRAVSESTKRFLHQMRDVVPHVLLVLTKMDKAFLDAMRRGGSEPWEQVEQARRIGTRRFAREIGRAPQDVLSISVAAQAAVEDSRTGLARRFDMEMEKLFQLLRHERALILGTRAAGVVRRCIAETAEAEQRAEAAYSQRIAQMEASRLPDPEAFRKTQLASTAAEIERAAENSLQRAERAVHEGFTILRAQCVQQLRGSRSREALLAAASGCERELALGIPRVAGDAGQQLEHAVDQEVRAIERGLFDKLRRRYQLIHDVRRSSSSLPRIEQAIEIAPPALALSAAVARSATSFKRLRIALGVVGVVVAATIGTLIAPGLGTIAGVALGPLLALVPTRTALERRAIAVAHAALERQEQALIESVGARAPSIRAGIEDALDRSLGRVIVRFGKFIAEPLDAEQQEIDQQRANLADLEEIRTALQAHDARLAELGEAALQESIGLCR